MRNDVLALLEMMLTFGQMMLCPADTNEKNPRSEERGFFICVRRTQHHLTEDQHHFEQSENIISHSSGHKTMLCFAQMMLRKAANDVGLRPMMLRFAQTES